MVSILSLGSMYELFIKECKRVLFDPFNSEVMGIKAYYPQLRVVIVLKITQRLVDKVY